MNHKITAQFVIDSDKGREELTKINLKKIRFTTNPAESDRSSSLIKVSQF